MVTLLLASIIFLVGMFWGWMRGEQAGWMRGQRDAFEKFTRELGIQEDREPPV